MEHAHCTELKDMLDLVGVKLGELQINDRFRQSSEYAVRNFAKKLYFRPGLDDNVKAEPDEVMKPSTILYKPGLVSIH